jgi:hypothetical protein
MVGFIMRTVNLGGKYILVRVYKGKLGMIAKLIKNGRIFLPTHKLSFNCQFIVHFSTQQTLA